MESTSKASVPSSPSLQWRPTQTILSSSAVAEKPRDASCHSIFDKSLKVTRKNNTVGHVYLSPSNKSLATNGHSNTVTRVSLECCTQTPPISVTNLPRSDSTVFVTHDGRTVDNTRRSEIIIIIIINLTNLHKELPVVYNSKK